MSTYPNEKKHGYITPQAGSGYEWDNDTTKEALPGQGPPERPPDGLIPYRPNEEGTDRDGQKILVDRDHRDHSAPEPVVHAYYSPIVPGADTEHDPRSSYSIGTSRWSHGIASGKEVGSPSHDRSRRRRKIIIACIVVLLIVVGGVLGGVLGTQLAKNNDDSNSNGNTDTDNQSNGSTPPSDPAPSAAAALRGIDKTGIATTLRGDKSGMLLYYQMSNGSIVETFYPNSNLSVTNAPTIRLSTQSLVPIRDISPSSPLAAVSFTANSTLQHLLFYTNSDLRLMLIRWLNTTTTTWTDPTMISPPAENTRLFAGSPGLCAVSSTIGGFQGARVYYSQRDGYVEELWWNFFNKDVSLPWNRGQTFPRADAPSGTACSAIQNGNDTYTNVYMRNLTTGGLAHWYLKSYGTGRRDAWTSVEESNVQSQEAFLPRNQSSMAAVVSGDMATQYVFFEGADGGMKMVSAEAGTPPARAAGRFFAFGPVESNRLAAYFVDGAPLVVNQFNRSQLVALRVGRQGSVLGNSTLVE
ncbi:Hypothetical protein D9617_21g096380 [Elsinoe fawcettii]|nr:Hypothetical protein D9617_21g096380 [Elsinoe fawcettii]